MGDMGSYALPESHRDVSRQSLIESEYSSANRPFSSCISLWWKQIRKSMPSWQVTLLPPTPKRGLTCHVLEARDSTATRVNRPHCLGKFHIKSRLRCARLAHVQ